MKNFNAIAICLTALLYISFHKTLLSATTKEQKRAFIFPLFLDIIHLFESKLLISVMVLNSQITFLMKEITLNYM